MHCIKISDIRIKQQDIDSQIRNILLQHICTFEDIKSQLKGDFTDSMIYETLYKIATSFRPDNSIKIKTRTYKKKKLFGYEITTGEFFIRTQYKWYYQLKESNISTCWITEPEIEEEKIEEPFQLDFISLNQTQPLLYLNGHKVIKKHYKNGCLDNKKQIGVL